MKNQTCQRCGEKTQILKGSFFNTDMCCKECLDKEQKHPLYQAAKDKELEEVKKGNYTFQGIGLPEDLQ